MEVAGEMGMDGIARLAVEATNSAWTVAALVEMAAVGEMGMEAIAMLQHTRDWGKLVAQLPLRCGVTLIGGPLV
ncbi:hypothetical protein E2562_036127 [Oryza meyeriana var. granulata]|uniref:Uncharacterized protein n=1 Tax=Oryza meyeriana var. granulata TaxID=110450 RepID=A0A6G1CAU2_9ORYZ|nr:hypothetical protein E2562_036127 [Oryza meyeriana var. granulata]